MLGPGRYLLGVAEIFLLGGFAWLGASTLRSRILPAFQGAPAHLASAVVALALLIWSAELLGTLGVLDPVSYLLVVAAAGIGLWKFLPRVGEGGPPHPSKQVGVRGTFLLTPGALLIAAIALLLFAWDAKSKLSTGMTGFDSTWYHGPFAAGFFQSGNTIDLHFIAPQFLAWFYPANGEIFHAVGMLAFGRDVLSPLLNIGWFAGCLLACWCIGRPYGVAPWSLALGAIALSVPTLSDQAGEARNDIVGIFFLLSAVAIALNARREWSTGAFVVVALAAGLAAGTKLNFLLPAGVLVLGIAALAPRGGRGRALVITVLAALAGGGYWYLRNLVHTGNPLPWIDSLGPISLPAPDQALGGREAHSVAGYLFDGAVWSDWFLPGLHDGLWLLWPLLCAAALTGLLLPLGQVSTYRPIRTISRHSAGTREGCDAPDWPLALAAIVGLATALAWLVAPTSASGPDGMPRGFESGLRYLAPALVLGLALLPTAPKLRVPLSRLALRTQKFPVCGNNCVRAWLAVAGAALLLAVGVGYPVQRYYLDHRYADPSFTTPGLNATFAWARDVSGARIATTSTRQYPLFGTDLSNHVQFVGEERSHGGFEAPTTCRRWRELLNEGDYNYVVASRDREETGKAPYPAAAAWTEGPSARVVLRKPPTVVFQVQGPLDPSACP